MLLFAQVSAFMADGTARGEADTGLQAARQCAFRVAHCEPGDDKDVVRFVRGSAPAGRPVRGGATHQVWVGLYGGDFIRQGLSNCSLIILVIST